MGRHGWLTGDGDGAEWRWRQAAVKPLQKGRPTSLDLRPSRYPDKVQYRARSSEAKTRAVQGTRGEEGGGHSTGWDGMGWTRPLTIDPPSFQLRNPEGHVDVQALREEETLAVMVVAMRRRRRMRTRDRRVMVMDGDDDGDRGRGLGTRAGTFTRSLTHSLTCFLTTAVLQNHTTGPSAHLP